MRQFTRSLKDRTSRKINRHCKQIVGPLWRPEVRFSLQKWRVFRKINKCQLVSFLNTKMAGVKSGLVIIGQNRVYTDARV